MAWLQISFVVEWDSVPLIEAALENSGALAVTLGDAANEPPLDSPSGTTPLEGVVKDLDSPLTGARTTALTNPISGLDDFELMSFLVVQEQE
ncbi:MAG: hypothetical protein LGR52_14450 [Candidatus Thiosymbion ectosymbiont of Robbea hypermnestra]|nr:hypothetical protein [Candidatus Thiosymbion ectosymbiont of Robbea hypermnestra]